MPSIFLHSPLNINLSLAEMLRTAAADIGQRHSTDVLVKSVTCYQREDGLLPLTLEQTGDMVVTYGSDLIELDTDEANGRLHSSAGLFPLREELSTKGFKDPRGIFHPIFLIPLIIIYNHKLVPEAQAPKKWEDLLGDAWRGQILFPDRHLPASRALLAMMQALFPDRFAEFAKNIVFSGSPVDVKNAVDEGQYPLGVNKVSFARFSRHKNLTMIWPSEGAFGLPNVMLWRAGTSDALLEMGHFLRSAPVQEFFLKNGYIPVSQDVPMLPEAALHDCRLLWQGWDWFLNLFLQSNVVP